MRGSSYKTLLVLQIGFHADRFHRADHTPSVEFAQGVPILKLLGSGNATDASFSNFLLVRLQLPMYPAIWDLETGNRST
jgi:hypothetical protein